MSCVDSVTGTVAGVRKFQERLQRALWEWKQEMKGKSKSVGYGFHIPPALVNRMSLIQTPKTIVNVVHYTCAHGYLVSVLVRCDVCRC